jgi:hypothetical protein
MEKVRGVGIEPKLVRWKDCLFSKRDVPSFFAVPNTGALTAGLHPSKINQYSGIPSGPAALLHSDLYPAWLPGHAYSVWAVLRLHSRNSVCTDDGLQFRAFSSPPSILHRDLKNLHLLSAGQCEKTLHNGKGEN